MSKILDSFAVDGWSICHTLLSGGLNSHFRECVRILLDWVNDLPQFVCGQMYGLQPIW